jgi:hypothetical protein
VHLEDQEKYLEVKKNPKIFIFFCLEFRNFRKIRVPKNKIEISQTHKNQKLIFFSDDGTHDERHKRFGIADGGGREEERRGGRERGREERGAGGID